jgi:hypothetical protein
MVIDMGGHFTVLALKLNHFSIKALFYDAADNSLYQDVIAEVKKIFAHKIMQFDFYAYKSDKKGKLQYSYQGCSWFALEAVFRLSKTELFADIQKKSIKEYQYIENVPIKYINPENLSDAMTAVFISNQSGSNVYSALPLSIKNLVISEKGLSLHETIQRRNKLGFNYFSHLPDLHAVNVPKQWPNPNKENAHEAQNKNWSILYFKMRQLEKMILWLSQDENQQLMYKKINKSSRVKESLSMFFKRFSVIRNPF